MPHYHIRSKSEAKYVVRVADCTPHHAQSVLHSLEGNPEVASDLELVEVKDLYDDQPYGLRQRLRGLIGG